MNAPVRLVYIASLSHSGSTLLDLLLNAHSHFVSVGELRKFSPHLQDQDTYKCTCGERALDGCAFWKTVVERLEAEGTRLDDIRTDRADPMAMPGNLALLKAIAEASSDAIIVDSSKTTDRLRQLLASPELDVLPVFLVRDARGQICSTLSKGKKTLRRAISEYKRTNRRIMQLLAGHPHVVISYEELASEPRAALEPILDHFGESFEASQLRWAEVEKHSLAGNRMRFGNNSAIRADERWRRDLTRVQRLAIQAGTWWTRRAIASRRARLQPVPRAR
jgi:hypothetical protein